MNRAYNLSFQRREGLQNPIDRQAIEYLFHLMEGPAVLAVAQELERDHAIAGAVRSDLACFLVGRADETPHVALGRFSAEAPAQLPFGDTPAPLEFAHATGRAQESFAVANVMHQLAEDQEPRVGFERCALRRIVAIGRFNQT